MNEEMSAKSSAIEAHDGDANDDDEQPRSLTESEKLQLNACSQLVKAAKASFGATAETVGKNPESTLTSIIISGSHYKDANIHRRMDGNFETHTSSR